MTVRSLGEVFLPGAAELPERLRTLSVTPTRFVEPGTTVEATFGFYNSGGATATGLRVRFAQPEGLNYVAGSAKIDGVPQSEMPDGAFVDPTGALLGEIAPGVERRVSVLYRVADRIEDGTTLSVQAALAANETTIVGSNIIRLVARSRPLLFNPHTTVSLEATAGAEPGRELLVRARVTNQGQSSANDVVLVFPIPEHTRYTQRSARIDGRILSDERGLPFEASAATIVASRLSPGQTVTADFIATIISPLDNGTLLQAYARISSREIQEFEIRSNEVLVASMPNFDGDTTALIIDGDDEVVPGMRLRMEMRAANIGTSSARRVLAEITLPTGLVYSPGSATLDGLPIGDELFESLTYAFDSMVPGAAVKLAFDAVVVAPAPADAKLSVGARLRWESGERNFSRTLTIRSEPRFTRAKNVVERGGAPVAQPGEDVTFVLHVLNEGTAAATDARLVLRGDSTLTVVGAESNVSEIQMVENSIILGTVAPHIEQLVTVTTRISSPLPDKAEVTLGAELVTAQLGSLDLGVASYIIRSRPRFSSETCGMRLRSNETLRPSRPVDVALRVVNSGTDTARDVRVILSYPGEVTVNALDGTSLVRAECLLETLAPGTVRELALQVALANYVPTGTFISIEARIEAAGLSPVPLNAIQIETRAEAEFAGELSLVSQPADAVDAGAPVSYTLRFRNVGDGPAQTVVIRLRPPEHLIYMPASTHVNSFPAEDENGTSTLWSMHGLVLTDVDPGIPVQVGFNAIVTSPIASGTILNAQATIQWEEQSLTIVSDDLVVRSTPEFASSPGGRSISIARIANQGNPPAAQRIIATPTFTEQPRAETPLAPPPSPPAVAPVAQAAAPSEPQFAEPQVAPTPAPALAVPERVEEAKTAPVPPSSFAPPEVEQEDADLPFFSPPPSAVASTPEPNPSSFAFIEAPPPGVVEFGEPPRKGASPQQVVAAVEAAPAEVNFAPPPTKNIPREAPAAQRAVRDVAPPEVVRAVPEASREVPVPEQAARKVPAPELTAREVPAPEAAREVPAPASVVREVPTPEPVREVPQAEVAPPLEPPQAVVSESPARALILEPVADEAVTTEEEHELPVVTKGETKRNGKLGERASVTQITAPISILAFAPDRLRRTLSFLQQSDYGKLVSHLFALEAFFPDRIQDEPELDDLFVAVRDAFRSTLDRLFVRLRLPRYAIAARDLEDRSSREAVIGLVKKVGVLPPIEAISPIEPVGTGIRIRGPIDRESLTHSLEAITDAPLGGVTPWIACVSLLGTTVETATESVDVLGHYRDALLAVLRVLESLPMSEFHRVLTNSSNAELDKALNDVVRVLGGPVEATAR